MLAAEGDSLAAWLRISMVARAWRECVAGACRFACLACGACIYHDDAVVFIGWFQLQHAADVLATNLLLLPGSC